jgi:hypothetical protein
MHSKTAKMAAHVLAEIRLATDVPDPKSDGVKSGYAPHHKFPQVEYLASGFHNYGNELVHYPGEVLTAEIVFPSWEFFGEGVKVGDLFEVCEMKRIVGYGKVLAVLADG